MATLQEGYREISQFFELGSHKIEDTPWPIGVLVVRDERSMYSPGL
jgi:hypothetical protein